MDDSYQQTIYKNLQNKDTDELLKIWVTNNQYEWTEEAFKVVKELLQERDVDLPEQNAPILTESDDIIAKDEEVDEEGPVFYRPENIFRLAKWINGISIAYLAIAIVGYGVLDLAPDSINNLLKGEYFPTSNYNWGLSLASFFDQVMVPLLIFVCVRAIPKLLMMLMEIEFNTRGEK